MMRPDADQVRRLALEQGFTLCGICAARPSAHGDFFRRWLADGKHGEMAWLADNVEVRLDPRELLAAARSILVVADALPPTRCEPKPAGMPGRVARYARISDYHKVMKKRLFAIADALRERHPDDAFRVCVDTAPLMEREHAQRAGLGWTGKHTLTLNRDRGSHLMLGAIVTTLDLPADPARTDHCGTCTRCIDACPTDAITPYRVDATRCISYLTIEHRSTIDPAFHEAIGDWLFGCDICQDVCPFVQRAAAPHTGPGPEAEADTLPPGYAPTHAAFDVAEVIDWTEDERRAAFRGSAMKRAKLQMIRRNALIVAANHLRQRDAPALRQRIEAIAADPDEPALVSQTARQVLDGLSDRSRHRD